MTANKWSMVFHYVVSTHCAVGSNLLKTSDIINGGPVITYDGLVQPTFSATMCCSCDQTVSQSIKRNVKNQSQYILLINSYSFWVGLMFSPGAAFHPIELLQSRMAGTVAEDSSHTHQSDGQIRCDSKQKLLPTPQGFKTVTIEAT